MRRRSRRDVLLAIDPGREKCGVAVVDGSGELLDMTLTPTAEVVTVAKRVMRRGDLRRIVVGNGTGSDDVRGALQDALPELPLSEVSEHHSTERALERWRDTERPRGWRRFLPRALRFPQDPIDGYAAWILAEDYLRDHDL